MENRRLRLESAPHPFHVAGLMILNLPVGAPKNHARKMVAWGEHLNHPLPGKLINRDRRLQFVGRSRQLASLPVWMFLASMDHTGNHEVHSVDGTVNRPITDLNIRKIASLRAATIAALNEIFEQRREIVEVWGHRLVAPDNIQPEGF